MWTRTTHSRSWSIFRTRRSQHRRTNQSRSRWQIAHTRIGNIMLRACATIAITTMVGASLQLNAFTQIRNLLPKTCASLATNTITSSKSNKWRKTTFGKINKPHWNLSSKTENLIYQIIWKTKKMKINLYVWMNSDKLPISIISTILGGLI